jgi:hypothetical protein
LLCTSLTRPGAKRFTRATISRAMATETDTEGDTADG